MRAGGFLPGAAVLIAALAAPPGWSADRPALVLRPGHAQMIRLPQGRVDTVFVARTNVADISLITPDSFMVFGISVGETTVVVHDEEGDTLWERIVRVAEEPPEVEVEVLPEVDRRPALDPEGAYSAVDAVTGLSDIRVRTAGGQYVLEGTARSPLEAERALRALESHAGEAPIVNLLRLRGPAQVNLEVVISEVARDVTERFGIDWSVSLNPFRLLEESALRGLRLATGGFQLTPHIDREGDLPTTTITEDSEGNITITQTPLGFTDRVERGPSRTGGIALGLTGSIDGGRRHVTAFIEALARNGLATIHAQPNLTALSGHEATFHSGMKVPRRVPGKDGGSGITHDNVGIDVTFTPTVLRDDRILLDVSTELSEIGSSLQVLGEPVPIFNDRSVETKVEVGDGESIAIAGLFRRADSTSTSGIPVLSELPLWGHLFKQTENRDAVLELIIIVTPRIVAGVPEERPASAAALRVPLSVPGRIEIRAADGAPLSVFQY